MPSRNMPPSSEFPASPSEPDAPRSFVTPYDPTVAMRISQQLETRTKPDGTVGYTGFIAPATPDSTAPSIATSEPVVEANKWWDIPGRAARYQRVVWVAGKAILSEEARVSEQQSGTARDYARSSFQRTQQLRVDDPNSKVLIEPDDFSGNNVYQQMMQKAGKKKIFMPDIPTTRRQRKGVTKIEQARRDASISAREIEDLEEYKKSFKGHPRSRHERHYEREIRLHQRKMHRKMRKIARVAEARDIPGRIARLFGSRDERK